MKKKVIISAFLIFLFFGSIVLANEVETYALWPHSFSTRAGSKWTYADGSYLRSSQNETVQHTATVDWQTSSQENRHNMWFRVVNSDGVDRGSALIPYLEKKTFNTSTTYNYKYYLQTRRENSVDPDTSVTGTWNH